MFDTRPLDTPALALVAVLTLALALPTAGVAQAGAEGPTGTLIVAGMNDNTVTLVDLPSGERRAVIAARNSPHEVAVSNDRHLAAVTNYGGQQAAGNLIQIIDIEAAEVVRELVIEGYRRLHGAAFLPGDSLLVLTSEQTGELLVVGASDGVIRRTIPTEGEASHMLALGGDWIYTANIVSGTVSRLDPEGRVETRVWPAGVRTEGIAATPDGTQGWTGSMEAGEVIGIDGATGEVVARITGLEVPYRLAVTPGGGTVIVSDPPAAHLVLIDRARGEVRARIDIGSAARSAGLAGDPSPQGFTVSPDGRWAFVSTKAIDRVALVDLVGERVVRFLPTGAGPDGIAFTTMKADARMPEAGAGGGPEAESQAVLDRTSGATSPPPRPTRDGP